MANGASDPSDLVRIVEQWQERAWGEFDLAAVDELMADPVLRHGPSGTALRTHVDLKHDLKQYQRTLCKPAIVVQARVVDGDCVWSRTTMNGHNLDTGEPRTVQWLQVYRIADGRITEIWALYANDVDW